MLNHPNIVSYFGVHLTPDFAFVFLELLIGGELFDQIGLGYHVRDGMP